MKRLLALFLLLGLGLPAHAMVRPMFGVIHGTPSNSANRFVGVDGSVVLSTSATGQRQVISASGTMGDLSVVLFAAPGVGTNYTVTLQRGVGAGLPADTTLTCTISDANKTCNDRNPAHAVSFSPGDTAVWKIVPTGTPAVSDITISSSFTGTNAGETAQPGGGGSGNVSTTNTNYFPTVGKNGASNIEASTTMFAPTAGSYDNLYVQFNGVATVGSYNIYLMLNDATSSLTCTVGTGASSCNDTTHSIAFVQGDKLALSIEPISTPTARVASWGFRFKPTVDGESIISGIGGLLSANSTRWFSIAGAPLANGSSPNATTTAPIAFTFKKSYFKGDNTASGGNTRSVILEQNGTATSLSATVSAPNNFGFDNTHSVSIAQDDLIQWKTTNTSLGNGSFFSIAATAFVDPSGAVTATHGYMTLTNGIMQIINGLLMLN